MKRQIVNAIVAHPKAVTLWKLRVYVLVLKSSLEEQDLDSARIALKDVATIVANLSEILYDLSNEKIKQGVD